jgi:hypothetical protein
MFTRAGDRFSRLTKDLVIEDSLASSICHLVVQSIPTLIGERNPTFPLSIRKLKQSICLPYDITHWNLCRSGIPV